MDVYLVSVGEYMKVWETISKVLGYNGPPVINTFVLEETPEEQAETRDGDILGDVVENSKRQRNIKRPKQVNQSNQNGGNKTEGNEISADLKENQLRLAKLFHLPKNKDIVIRNFNLGCQPEVEAFIIFINNITDQKKINQFILQPLMLLTNLDHLQEEEITTWRRVLQNYLPENQVKVLQQFNEVLVEITAGSTVIFFQGSNTCLSVETIGFAYRNVEAARTEQVVQGPQEGFNESLQDNCSLIRKHIRSADLISEYLKVGQRNQTRVAVMYIADLANGDLVHEVMNRIKSIKADYLPETGILEEFIEDHTYSLIPQTIKTERPDRVASMLIEGKVAILVENNPFVMVVPATFWDLLHSPEDHYVRFPYGFWLRFIRLAAVFLTVLLPAFYVAVATFHQEMIPTDLLLSIAAAKEKVPFPTIVEVLLMELSFELIREAGVRVPGIIGPTVGIVGALILGQAAVAASLVSPILIIIVAVTGLASYAIPSYSAAFGFRFMRFIFIYLAATLGFFGISTGLFIVFCLLLSMHSFGVPFMSPMAPKTASGTDVMIRYPAWQQEQRPDYLQTQDRLHQPNISRGWLKVSRKGGGSSDKGQNRRD